MDNPYQSPAAATGGESSGLSIQYRVFEGKWFTFSARGDRDQVRERALVAIDEEFGAENVVSIGEHEGPPFSVIVWYRRGRSTKSEAPNSKQIQKTE